MIRFRSPRAEAAGLNPAQCWCESNRKHFPFMSKSKARVAQQQRRRPQKPDSASATLAAGIFYLNPLD